jgi:hypothetical protein
VDSLVTKTICARCGLAVRLVVVCIRAAHSVALQSLTARNSVLTQASECILHVDLKSRSRGQVPRCLRVTLDSCIVDKFLNVVS